MNREYETAVQQARISMEEGGIPIGAALWNNGKLIGYGHNKRVQNNSAILHGEIDCIDRAGRREDYSLCTLYTTLSPCSMCAGSIVLFQIPRVVIGDSQTFLGEIDYLLERGVSVEVLGDPVVKNMLSEFAARYPNIWSEDIGGR